MEVGTALGGTGLFVSVAGIIYSAINHKHIKSTCCGRNFDFSIDIDSTLSENEVREKEAKEKEAREKEAKEKEAREKEAKEKEAREKEAREKEAKEKEAKEKEAKVGNSKFDDYSIFKLKPRIVPHFNV
jgi:flagellar biosynthesis GTPase FlhF